MKEKSIGLRRVTTNWPSNSPSPAVALMLVRMPTVELHGSVLNFDGGCAFKVFKAVKQLANNGISDNGDIQPKRNSELAFLNSGTPAAAQIVNCLRRCD